MKNIILILILTLLYSCKENNKNQKVIVNQSTKIEEIPVKTEEKPTQIGKLPTKRNVISLKKTDFVGTLENTFNGQKNYIYSPTLAFAWNEIQDKLKDIKIIEDKNNKDLALLNSTQTNFKSLDKNEFKTEISISKNNITAKSEFNLELTFKPFLESLEFPIIFKTTEVEGFGMIEWEEQKANQLEIIYFEDNDNFIFKLTPQENNNELIFIKGLNCEKAISFKEAIEIYYNKKELAKTEKKNKNLIWKYKLEYDETFSIPELAFNLEKSFKTIEGQKFTSNNVEYLINIIKQRNALLLNNKGAKIESEAKVYAAAAAIDTEGLPVKITKHLTLDNTFFLIIKHSDRNNPYFCAKIDNTELMTKKAIK